MPGNDVRHRSRQVQLLSLSSSSQQIVERLLCDKGLIDGLAFKTQLKISIITATIEDEG